MESATWVLTVLTVLTVMAVLTAMAALTPAAAAEGDGAASPADRGSAGDSLRIEVDDPLLERTLNDPEFQRQIAEMVAEQQAEEDDLPGWVLWVCLGVPIVGVVTGFVVWQRLEKRRRAAIAALAERWGMKFRADEKAEIGGCPADFELFRSGHSKRQFNALTGDRAGLPIAIFDYEFTVGSGRYAAVHRQTVAAIQLRDGVNLPAFLATPEGFFQRLGQKLGMSDIDFADQPAFSQAFVLRGEDEAPVRRLFDYRLTEALLRHPDWSVEGRGRWLLVYRKARRVKPEAFAEFHDDAIALAATIETRAGRG